MKFRNYSSACKLQAIHDGLDVRNQVFSALRDLVPAKINPNNGRRGVDLWKILVLGTLRLNCNWDYDKLMEIANEHRTLRLILGHGIMDHDFRYALQTLKDNVSLFTPEILDKIDLIVIGYGYEIVGKRSDEKLNASCDSFVLKTDVHYNKVKETILEVFSSADIVVQLKIQKVQKFIANAE